jgi:hypothetical protein
VGTEVIWQGTLNITKLRASFKVRAILESTVNFPAFQSRSVASQHFAAF